MYDCVPYTRIWHETALGAAWSSLRSLYSCYMLGFSAHTDAATIADCSRRIRPTPIAIRYYVVDIQYYGRTWYGVTLSCSCVPTLFKVIQ